MPMGSRCLCRSAVLGQHDQVHSWGVQIAKVIVKYSWSYELAGFRASIRGMQDLAGLGLHELQFFVAAVLLVC